MKRNNNHPLVSLLIVNWNGKFYLEKCLKSLSKISYKNAEIIVVDQNSSDGSVDLVRKKFPRTILICNSDNTGYVGGNNLAAQNANGKYIVILNNDIEVDKGFLEPLVAVFEKNRKLGVAQPKAINIRYKGTLDGGGSFMSWNGFLFHKGYLEKANQPEYNTPYPVYSVKGAYMMTRLDLFLRLGGLDRDFFIYFEESDYCGRVWVAGYTVMYLPESIVYHWGGGDTSQDWKKRFALIQYRSIKNRICSYIKNFSSEKLLSILPIHIAACLGLSLYYLFTGNWQTSGAIINALLWNALHLKKTLQKRKVIQGLRKRSDKEIFDLVQVPVGLRYYFHQMQLLLK